MTAAAVTPAARSTRPASLAATEPQIVRPTLRRLILAEKKSMFYSLWFSAIMTIVSFIMFAEYTRLVLTTDDSIRRIVVLCIWGIIAVTWTITFIVRLRNRRSPSET